MKHVMNETTETIVTNVQDEDVQPNAIDLRIGKILTHVKSIETVENGVRVQRLPTFSMVDNVKEHIPTVEVKPENGVYKLSTGYYMVEMENRIQVGEHESGLVVPRSTLMRNGVILFSCLYDSGYCGKMIADMQVFAPVAILGEHERVGQYLCFDAESLHQYNGSYQEKSL